MSDAQEFLLEVFHDGPVEVLFFVYAFFGERLPKSLQTLFKWYPVFAVGLRAGRFAMKKFYTKSITEEEATEFENKYDDLFAED